MGKKAFEMKNCPRCGEDTMDENQVMNALSRRDNHTYICSPCGTQEAFVDMGMVGEIEWYSTIAKVEETIKALVEAGRISLAKGVAI